MASLLFPTLEEFNAWLKTQKPPKRYNAAIEDMPDTPWSRLPRAIIDTRLKEFGQRIIVCLGKFPYDDKELDHVEKAAQSVSQVKRSPAMQVAFIGSQAAGKSTLLCAFFSLEGASPTGASGKACTSTAIRYKNYAEGKDGPTKFHGQTRFLKTKKLEAMFKELCRHYYYFHHAEEDSEDEDDPESEEAPDQSKLEALKDTAEDILVALWGSKQSFLESWSPSVFKSGAFVRLCQLKFKEAIEFANVDSDSIAYMMGSDQHQLLSQMIRFMSQVEGEKCLWPLVDHVMISFYNQWLEQGLELIDLPGCGDSNRQRARHADEIRDSVQVEVVVCNTARIESDEMFIQQARTAINLHGAANVRLVATNIDSISDNQQGQDDREPYRTINRLLRETQEMLASIDDDEDEEENFAQVMKRNQLEKRMSHLKRCDKQHRVAERAQRLSRTIGEKLQGRSASTLPPLIHTSAAQYMEWLEKPKFTFKDQPDFSVEETGIPRLRRELLALTAPQNMQDYENHVFITAPAVIEKIIRTVREDIHEGGFVTIADAFEVVGQKFMVPWKTGVVEVFRDSSDKSMKKLRADIPALQNRINMKVEEWCKLKFAAFNRAMKGKGVLPDGKSYAKSPQSGRNLDKELSDILTPGISKWANTHASFMAHMEEAFCKAIDQLHRRVINELDDAGGNMVTVEKAKTKWHNDKNSYPEKIKTDMMVLVTDVQRLTKRASDWAIMKDGRENNLVGSITNEWYDDIHDAAPKLKPPVPGRKQKKVYEKPGRFQFQKNRMKSHFSGSKVQFVEHAFQKLQAKFDRDTEALVDKHFEIINDILSEFAEHLRGRKMLDYQISEHGRAIRADLKELLPHLQDELHQIQSLFPQRVKEEDGASPSKFANYADLNVDDATFPEIYDRVMKTKKPAQAPKRSTKRDDDSKTKRMRIEQS